ncbi:MAG: aminodeoxychorismate/anthranilate synthase component II [Pseudomonadota bacterium]
MILIIDNYDSFTYNLVQLLAPFEVETQVVRNDALSAEDACALNPGAIILSPGPCTPDDAGICLALVEKAQAAKIPLFGVCLGHQSIAQALGGKVVRAGKPMHGKVSTVTVKPDPLFQGMPESFEATRYHSLTVDQASLPGVVEVLATADDDGEIMALKVRSSMTYGVQFHPESFASPTGGQILGNFLRLAGQRANA